MDFYKKIQYQDANHAINELEKDLQDFQLIHLSDFTFDIQPESFYQLASEKLGEVQAIDEDKASGTLTGERWIDITFDPAEPNKYRSSNTRQPFHTDDSYIEIEGAEGRVTFFYCSSQANLGGATTFVSTENIMNALLFDEEFELLNDLQNIPVKFSKSDSNKTRPILNCVDSENTPEALDLAKRFHEFLENRVLMAGLGFGVQLKPGEAVFFHDHRLLHGRNAFFTKELGGRKLIKGAFVLK
jgi:alpha-ketoglutarate-dependent taurine dioxygenase